MGSASPPIIVIDQELSKHYGNQVQKKKVAFENQEAQSQ